MTTALKQFGLDGYPSLNDLALKKFGSQKAVDHQIALLKDRAKRAASRLDPRAFPPASVAALGTAAYVQYFEQFNHYKPATVVPSLFKGRVITLARIQGRDTE